MRVGLTLAMKTSSVFSAQMYILLLLVFMKVVQPVLNLPALPSQPITDAVCNTLDGSGSACWEQADRSYEETVVGGTSSQQLLSDVM